MDWQTDPALDVALEAVAPELEKWAAIIVVDGPVEAPTFHYYQYQQTAQAQNFWPASAIKLYTVVAALESLTEHGLGLETVVSFERQMAGTWLLDCARTVREMVHRVFRQSSNEDYTLLLRWAGVDHLNQHFLTPEKGFAKSALMRGYVTAERPYGYALDEPQRITLRDAAGHSATLEHHWSGKSYSAERGATVLDAQRGNVTTPGELAECLRRVMFHDVLPATERYAITAEQAAFLQHGGAGCVGLETRLEDSGPYAWTQAAETVFPHAKFYHKCGVISNYALEAAYVDDLRDSGKRFLLVPVIHAGHATKPVMGETLIAQMSKAIALWVRGR